MTQRDTTAKELSRKCEADHRDSFYFCLLRNHHLIPRIEFPVIKPDQTNGRIDLLLQIPGWLIVTEWKFYRINFLDVHAVDLPAKADILRDYGLSRILQLKFTNWDQFRKENDIKSWVVGSEAPQLRSYIKSDNVQQLMKERRLRLQAHLVIIVGSRHILLWDMNEEGKLDPEPRLVETPSRSNRQDS